MERKQKKKKEKKQEKTIAYIYDPNGGKTTTITSIASKKMTCKVIDIHTNFPILSYKMGDQQLALVPLAGFFISVGADSCWRMQGPGISCVGASRT